MVFVPHITKVTLKWKGLGDCNVNCGIPSCCGVNSRLWLSSSERGRTESLLIRTWEVIRNCIMTASQVRWGGEKEMALKCTSTSCLPASPFLFSEDHSRPNLCLRGQCGYMWGWHGWAVPFPFWPTGPQSLIFSPEALGPPFLTSLLVHTKASKLSRNKCQVHPTE